MISRWPSQNTFGMWTVLYRTRSPKTEFGVSINVWRLAGNTLNKVSYATKCFYKYQYTHTTCLIRSYVHQLNLTVQQEEDCVSTESKVKGGFHYLALEIMNTRYPQDKWLHIFTDGSQLGYIKAAAGIDCELFSCYIPLGQHSKPYELHYVC